VGDLATAVGSEVADPAVLP